MIKGSYIRNRPHLVNGKPVKPDDVIRVRMIDEPTYEQTDFDRWEWETGEFEWAYYQDGKLIKFNVDMHGLKNEVDTSPFAGRYKDVFTKVTNFWKVFLIIPTGEIIIA